MATDWSKVTPTAPSSVGFRGVSVDLHRDPTTLDGSAYTEHGSAFLPSPALSTTSFTNAAAGGAPGAAFGVPGAAGAPVDNGSGMGLSPLQLGLGLALVGYLAWRILR